MSLLLVHSGQFPPTFLTIKLAKLTLSALAAKTPEEYVTQVSLSWSTDSPAGTEGAGDLPGARGSIPATVTSRRPPQKRYRKQSWSGRRFLLEGEMMKSLKIILLLVLAGTRFTLPAYAAGQKSWVFKGTCIKGNIAESNGVQTGVASGTMFTKDYFALMQKARASHLTVGSDGFLWSTQPLHCDSVAIMQMDDYKGHRMVTFSNSDPDNPILGFAGGLVDGYGTILLADTVYLTDGKAMPLNPGPNAPKCQFYYTNDGHKGGEAAARVRSNHPQTTGREGRGRSL
jgi:hypothetical protein